MSGIFSMSLCKDMSDVLVFLTVQRHCHGRAQNLAPLFGSEFIQALQLQHQKQADEHQLFQPAPPLQNRVLQPMLKIPAVSSESVNHPWERLRARIGKIKLVAEFQQVNQLEKYDKQVTNDRIRRKMVEPRSLEMEG